MKSLHVEMGRHRLGGTMQVYYLMRGLKARGEPAVLVCPKGSVLHEMAVRDGLAVRPVEFGGDADLRFISRFMRILREERPDIVHLHSRRGADTLGLVAARLAGIGKVIVSRRVDDPVKPGWLTRLRYVKLPDLVITVSKGIARVLEAAGVPPGQIRQVYSAIDVRAYQSSLDGAQARMRLGLPAGAPVLVVIAQLIPRKGHRFLLQALPSILAKHPDTRVLFAGEGESEAELRAQVQATGLESCVQFLGYRNDIGDILRACDLLVHPATMEGFANVAMQAMAAGIPVVSSAVGGMPESVRDGVTGLLVPPQDPAALAEAVIKLLDDPGLRERLGRQGREIVEREFTTDVMVEGNLAVYRGLLDGRH
ncbi:glycosyltransferase [Ideonella sp.]|uniref:glycosyltransferase n=1 Tax=Ideonella sp. TaxID=1929293 RepID=UPI002B496D0D|nr:glycosyltransferase [Ideonella sp.]HJV67910.1 glycosyltransferase [Ideonella sp.]